MIELIGAVLVFWEFPDDTAVDERGVWIVIPGIGGIPPAVLKALLLRLQFFCIPADIKAVPEIVVLHIADIALWGMDAVYGDLLARPLSAFDRRNVKRHLSN